MGGSLCGLVTSKVLSKYFDEVVILEMDEITKTEIHTTANQLPTDLSTINRKGVPQYTQPHSLSAGGYGMLEDVFYERSVTSELEQLGAVSIDYTRQVRTITGSTVDQQPQGKSSVVGLGCSRHLLETVLRNRIHNVPNVTLVSGVKVYNLIIDVENNQIQGVIVQQHKSDLQIEADLVVDATGRGSQTSKWLKQGGLEAPAVTKVDAHLRYGCRVYQLSNPLPHNNLMIAQIPHRNSTQKHIAIIIPIEGNRVQLVLSGYNYEGPPRDESGYLQYISQLDSAEIFNEICQATPLTPIVGFGNTANVIRSYHKINMPKGLAVIGDACTCLNPVKGMGMGKLMQEVKVFDSCLQCCSQNGFMDLKKLSVILQSKIYEVARFAVMSCAVGDSFLQFANVKGNQDGVLQNSFLEYYYWTVLSQVPNDGVIGYAALRVSQNLDDPINLLHPCIIARVAWNLILNNISAKKDDFQKVSNDLYSSLQLESGE